MIINNDILHNTYRCKEIVKNYLLKKGLPILSYDKDYFYFAKTEKLKDALKTMPLLLKIVASFGE